MTRKLVLISGKRKAGTTFLFHSLDAAWRPGVKDRSWAETLAQFVEFARGEAPSGVVAKADAIYDAQSLISAAKSAGLGPDSLQIVVLDRQPYERFLSYLAHARKGGWMPLKRARAGFEDEERDTRWGIELLESAGYEVTRLAYEDLAAGRVTQVCDLVLKPVESRRNARGERLPMFGLISRFVEMPFYAGLRDSRALMALKSFYYRRVAGLADRPNGAVKAVVLGSVGGPVDGQRRLTGLFCRKTSFSVRLFDYNGHRKWWGFVQILWQFLGCALLALRGRVDIVYLAISRTQFGLLRDFLLLWPLRLSGTRVVAHVHGAEFEKFYFRETGLTRLKERQLGQIDRLLFIHEALCPAQPELVSKIAVLRNPVPHFDVADRTAPELSGVPRLGFISSFVPGKGLEDFLALADHLGDRATYLVAGGVHPKFIDYGHKMVAEIEQRTSLSFLGYLDSPFQFYRQVDHVIFPTSYVSEAVPGVVIEALSSGCTAVVRRTNCLPDVFAGSTVQWFDTRQELFEVVGRLVEGEGEGLRARSDASVQWVRNAFPSEASWIDRLEAHLIGEGSGS